MPTNSSRRLRDFRAEAAGQAHQLPGPDLAKQIGGASRVAEIAMPPIGGAGADPGQMPDRVRHGDAEAAGIVEPAQNFPRFAAHFQRGQRDRRRHHQADHQGQGQRRADALPIAPVTHLRMRVISRPGRNGQNPPPTTGRVKWPTGQRSGTRPKPALAAIGAVYLKGRLSNLSGGCAMAVSV